jgi:hypothetical protein
MPVFSHNDLIMLRAYLIEAAKSVAEDPNTFNLPPTDKQAGTYPPGLGSDQRRLDMSKIVLDSAIWRWNEQCSIFPGHTWISSEGVRQALELENVTCIGGDDLDRVCAILVETGNMYDDSPMFHVKPYDDMYRLDFLNTFYHWILCSQAYRGAFEAKFPQRAGVIWKRAQM